VYWDRIKHIKYAGYRDTYDIEVKNSDNSEPNFYANGFITHNSSLAAAILWCLFGRTINKDRPGDGVINWFTGKDCFVQIETVDGYVITRTRKSKGVAELSITKDGTDQTQSTTENTQKYVIKLFGLDFEIFTSCVFFGQLGKSFLELTDAKRRAILERVFNLHRINIWAEVAKEKISTCEVEQARFSVALDSQQQELTRMQKELEARRADQARWEQDCASRVAQAETRKKALESELLNMQVPDVVELKRQWTVIEKIQDKLNEYETEKRKKATLAFSLGRDISRITGEEAAWKAKAGTTCPSCKQAIGKEHVASICEPFSGKKRELQSQIDAHQSEIARIEGLIEVTQKKVENAGPKQTVIEAEAVCREIERIRQQIEGVTAEVKRIKSEQNPYGDMIKRGEASIRLNEAAIEDLADQVKKYNILLLHLQYIFNAYNDKKKLKSFMLGDLVPFLNERVGYYLKAFDCEFDLKFTPTLQDSTSKWDYDYCSGGERKRIDLAVMFALYDLYVAIYGIQCNVMVLDEVDGRLDTVGVQAFVDVIEKDFVKKGNQNRPDAVFVISHKDEMRDAFPSKIKVVKEGGFSKIVEAR
jgi:DNA repair exonuclease SbcCD ATPase subunit